MSRQTQNGQELAWSLPTFHQKYTCIFSTFYARRYSTNPATSQQRQNSATATSSLYLSSIPRDGAASCFQEREAAMARSTTHILMMTTKSRLMPPQRPQTSFALVILDADDTAMEVVQLVEECSLNLLDYDDWERCTECTDSLLFILSKFIRLHSLSIGGVLVCPRLIQTLAQLRRQISTRVLPTSRCSS
ncbi:hypothetical protein C8J56DRAFT_187776 [Mycena floridula]|nr:hypothetical protein C8J56DRAFT_187776 [Mycena floridula]